MSDRDFHDKNEREFNDPSFIKKRNRNDSDDSQEKHKSKKKRSYDDDDYESKYDKEKYHSNFF